MCSRSVFLLVFGALGQGVSASGSSDWQATCRDVIGRLEYRQSIANPMCVTLTRRLEKYDLPGTSIRSGVWETTVTIAKNGNLLRVDRIQNGRKSWAVYDGSKAVIDNRGIRVVNDQNRREFSVSIDPKHVDQYPTPFDASGEDHWLAVMKDCLSRPNEVEGESKIDDDGLLELRLAVRLEDGEIWTNRAWLDTKHDYIPTRIETDLESDGKNERVRIVEKTQDCSGLRLAALVRVVATASSLHRGGLPVSDEVFELKSCSLDARDMPARLFQADLSGDVVLEDLDHGGVLTSRDEIDAYLKEISGKTWTTWTFWIGAINVTLVLFVAWRIYVARS